MTSVDIDPKSNATYTADVCDWEPPAGESWDCVWASPPCTEFSRALTSRPRRLEEGLRIARRCLELIAQLRPKVWFLENPGTGLLPKQSLFEDLPYNLVAYCKYGFPYKKLTWVANNCTSWQPHPLLLQGVSLHRLEQQSTPRVRSTRASERTGRLAR